MPATSNSETFKLGSRTVRRIGYGAMRLSGPGIFGPPKDHDAAVAVLREAVASGVNHIDTAEFYRSPDRVLWTPTGINVPDYPKLAQIWWQQIGDVNAGTFTPQEAMDRLAGEMDLIMARVQAVDESDNVYGGCGPRLNEEKDPSEWLGREDGPAAKLENEKPQGETIDYDELVQRWQKG